MSKCRSQAAAFSSRRAGLYIQQRKKRHLEDVIYLYPARSSLYIHSKGYKRKTLPTPSV
jgi:hypothetical protein